jgi:hypothetical protein
MVCTSNRDDLSLRKIDDNVPRNTGPRRRGPKASCSPTPSLLHTKVDAWDQIIPCPFTGIPAEGGSGPAFTPGRSRGTKCSVSAPFTGLPPELHAASPGIEEARERA